MQFQRFLIFAVLMPFSFAVNGAHSTVTPIEFRKIAPKEVANYQLQVTDYKDCQRAYDNLRLKVTEGKLQAVPHSDPTRQEFFKKARERSKESVETLKKIKEKMSKQGIGEDLSLKEIQTQLEEQLNIWADSKVQHTAAQDTANTGYTGKRRGRSPSGNAGSSQKRGKS